MRSVLRHAAALLSAALLAACQAPPPPAPGAEACAAREGSTQYLCGIRNVEKLVPIAGTRWAIASAIAGGPAPTPPLYFLHLQTQRYLPLEPASIQVRPDAATFPGCEPPDFSAMNSVGMDVRTVRGQTLFYSVNHGKRMTVEVFALDTQAGTPALTWRGCVQAPSRDWFLDDVAVRADGSMVVSSLFDLTNPAFKDFLEAGRPIGKLGLWRPGQGWTTLPIGSLSGPNGVALSADEQQVFVADWGGKGLARLQLATGRIDRVDLGFRVDNVVWDTARRHLLAGGQHGSVAEVFACFESATRVNCDTPFSVVAIDPATLRVTPLFGPGTAGVVGVGTGALQDGDSLWLTSFRSDRLPRIAYPLR